MCTIQPSNNQQTAKDTKDSRAPVVLLDLGEGGVFVDVGALCEALSKADEGAKRVMPSNTDAILERLLCVAQYFLKGTVERG